MNKHEKTGRLLAKVLSRIHSIINEHAWADGKGGYTIEQENFENLEITLSAFITPLLRKAGWFVDEDDSMLTRVDGGEPFKFLSDEEAVDLEK